MIDSSVNKINKTADMSKNLYSAKVNLFIT
ncbi:hypothetical protein GFV14_00721 [Candidatus Hartigia pinicola]|nr:hypothetical protein GFV14_00721 [Candidatus Hartigia pinicola]